MLIIDPPQQTLRVQVPAGFGQGDQTRRVRLSTSFERFFTMLTHDGESVSMRRSEKESGSHIANRLHIDAKGLAQQASGRMTGHPGGRPRAQAGHDLGQPTFEVAARALDFKKHPPVILAREALS